MNDYNSFIRSADLHVKATRLVLSTAPLQRQIQNCYRQLLPLLSVVRTPEVINQIRDLQDEIFGCDIEIQSISLKSKRMLDQARLIRARSADIKYFTLAPSITEDQPPSLDARTV